MSSSLGVWLQYLLPKHALTTVAGWFASARAGGLTAAVIRWFVVRYGVDMSEALQSDPAQFATFNDFFTRALAPGARPIAAADFVCPVDGAISQIGAIDGGRIFQAKGHHYSTVALVGGDATMAKQFDHGTFATIYLSPKDYHRIHMPCDGRLLRMTYVPGALFSVNPDTARGVPGLFARNERVVCLFEGAHGPFVMVLVGATIVGSMATVWHGVVNPPRSRAVRTWAYDDRAVMLRKGDEMGRFQLGSTVVLLFAKDQVALNVEWTPVRSVRMGEVMGARSPRQISQ
jgi:phosphatidylserine decarboxylase